MEATDGPTDATGMPAVSSTAYFMKDATWSDEPRATVTRKLGFLARMAFPASASVFSDASSSRATASGISLISRIMWVGLAVTARLLLQRLPGGVRRRNHTRRHDRSNV